ncbi:myb-like protein X, partial [Mercenaria mercenaria]|uniref:myb-like protein X n=1 Tax=Mercenaria mercenaria TaxID=6596 RepID=UPI00234EEC7A
MRCSRTGCGKEGDGKFCDECGAKMVDERMDTVVICSGKLEDDSPCGAELEPSQKFCKNCGVKVDQSLFSSLQDTCPNCGKVLEQEAKFCMECGHRLKKPVGGQHSSVMKEVESSGRVDKTGMESLAERKENNLVVKNDAVLSAGSKDGDGDNIMKGEKNIDAERKENRSLTEESGGHSEKREENEDNNIKPDSSGSENSDKSHSEMTYISNAASVNTEAAQATENKSYSKLEDDAGMAVNESDISTENGEEQAEISKNDIGNISIIHENSKTDLSEQLEEVHIGKDKPGNLNIVDSTKTDSNDENKKKDMRTTSAEAKVGEDEEDTMEVQSYGNGQVKRSKSQKENEKKRKQETEETRLDKDREVNAEEISEGPELTASNESVAEDSNDKSKATDKTEKCENKNKDTNAREKMDSKNSSGTEITIPEQSGMVFGSGRSFGMNEMGGNYEVKTPYGNNLFTLSNKPSTGGGLDDEQVRGDDNVNNNEALSPPDNDMAAEDTVIYSNDFTESNGQTDKEGTDVDKPAGMETRSKAKAKVAEENKANKQQSKKPSKTEDKQLKAAERKFNEKCIKIQFHVLTSEEFRFEPSKDKCILVMGNKEMGGWKKKDRLMREKRKIEGFIYEMVYEEMIPTRLVAGGSSIPYKYVIIKQDKPEKEYWDHYMKNYKTGEGYDRDLTVSLKLKSI